MKQEQRQERGGGVFGLVLFAGMHGVVASRLSSLPCFLTVAVFGYLFPGRIRISSN